MAPVTLCAAGIMEGCPYKELNEPFRSSHSSSEAEEMSTRRQLFARIHPMPIQVVDAPASQACTSPTRAFESR